ncbi:hypothetical protein EDC01DRAFT_642701 [Geopyxis carbonaria]|nr:hypothetical protein EDC01DRAFT_642701 [Geopyxis carbonaria]
MLEQLPLDLKVQILKQIDDFSSLCAFLEVSKDFCLTFQQFPVHILTSIVANEIGYGLSSYIPDAISLLSASHALADPTTPASDIEAFVERHGRCVTGDDDPRRRKCRRKRRHPDDYNTPHEQLLAQWALLRSHSADAGSSSRTALSTAQTLRLLHHNRDVRLFAERFLRSELGRIFPLRVQTAVQAIPISAAEYSRAASALYRVWLHATIFRPCLAPGTPGFRGWLLPAPVHRAFVTALPSRWEMEVFEHVFRRVRRRLQTLVEEVYEPGIRPWRPRVHEPHQCWDMCDCGNLGPSEPGSVEYSHGIPHCLLLTLGIAGLHRLIWTMSREQQARVVNGLAARRRHEFECEENLGRAFQTDNDLRVGWRYEIAPGMQPRVPRPSKPSKRTFRLGMWDADRLQKAGTYFRGVPWVAGGAPWHEGVQRQCDWCSEWCDSWAGLTPS